MTPALADTARTALADQVLLAHPHTAAVVLEQLTPGEVARLFETRDPAAAAPVLARMVPERSAQVVAVLADGHVRAALSTVPAPRAAAILAWLVPEDRERVLRLLGEADARELRDLLAYPPNTAGALMDPRVFTVRETDATTDALERLRDAPGEIREIYAIDDEHRLAGVVPLHRLALAGRGARIASIVQPAPGMVTSTVTREELVEYLARTGLPSIAVVDAEGTLIGVLRHAALVGAAEEEALIDLQRMVGASVDERALSPIGFAVKKRLPWLNINLLTAFLAAAVVGLFESTIATVSALAVMLSVVAGSSGNSGAQALAVTMRGLALREVRGSHWRRLAFKEAMVGGINGFAIAIVAGLGVLVWSRSIGLAVVMAISMVLAMATANFAGASIPILLKRFGQDPAQSASIFLTTVTDIVGFFVFLGLATLAITML